MTSRLALIIAIVVGGMAAFLVREVVENSAAFAGRERSSTIVVARRPIAYGEPLVADNLKVVPWRSGSPLVGSFATVQDLTRDGRRLALLSLQPNEPVLETRITGPNQRATLATQIENGMRAVTIRVDEVRGVAGFILPGDRVDVISTRGEEGGQGQGAYADVLLQDVKVLAIDQLSDERQDKPTVARAVTLELTVQQAQKVVLAQGIGRLSLALRQPNAVADDPSSRVTVSDLGGPQAVPTDRLAELDRRLDAMKADAAAARSQSDRDIAKALTDFETRIRGELKPPPALAPVMAAKAPPLQRPSSVINVIRNGSKTESYTVSAER